MGPNDDIPPLGNSDRGEYGTDATKNGYGQSEHINGYGQDDRRDGYGQWNNDN
jgi:hypothetical protein